MGESGRQGSTPDMGDILRRIEVDLAQALADRDHWKANHDDQVRRKRAAQNNVQELRGALRDIEHMAFTRGIVDIQQTAREAMLRPFDSEPS